MSGDIRGIGAANRAAGPTFGADVANRAGDATVETDAAFRAAGPTFGTDGAFRAAGRADRPGMASVERIEWPWRPAVVLLAALAAAACATATGESADRCDQDFGDPAESEYVLPFTEGRTYRVIQSYCPENPNWGHYGWFAYDFDLATGDTIVASRAGFVRFMREDQPDIGGRCGVDGENLILIQHPDGSVMFYVHLTTDGVLVERGEQVEQGQPIGLSGNSGCSSGPHLHVTLFPDASDYGREASLPFNYVNAEGPLDDNGGLIYNVDYTALPVDGTG